MTDTLHLGGTPAHADDGHGHGSGHDAYMKLGPISMRREYVMVLVVLSVLTIAEVGVTYLKIDKRVMGALLVGMALTKAAFVGLYYMHLKYEKRSLLWLAAVPLPLAGLYAAGLMLDANALIRVITMPWIHGGH